MHQVIKTYVEVETPLHLGTRWMCVVGFKPQPSCPRYPLDNRKLGYRDVLHALFNDTQ
jgi:hypothetical protein